VRHSFVAHREALDRSAHADRNRRRFSAHMRRAAIGLSRRWRLCQAFTGCTRAIRGRIHGESRHGRWAECPRRPTQHQTLEQFGSRRQLSSKTGRNDRCS
jgi:hypothetical protein